MRYRITSNGFPVVKLSKIEKGEKFYAECNSCIASSPIFNEADNKAGKPTGGLVRRRLLPPELEGEDYTPEERVTKAGQAWANFTLGTKQTMDRKRIGEKSYVLYEALEDRQKITFRSCFPGTIMAWDATPLAAGEMYVEDDEDAKSIFSKDEADRPHGTLRAVKGSFLVANLKVKAKVYHTKDVQVVKLSETKDSFQEFSGNGMVFLEVHGDLLEIPLYPGEAVDVFPGYLLAFTEGVTLEMKAAGDVTLRNEENNDYLIQLTAGPQGGYVYTHSVKMRDFFKRNDCK